jgi:hypothetical protein
LKDFNTEITEYRGHKAHKGREWGEYLPPVFFAKSAEVIDCKGVVENTPAKEFVRM